MITYVHILLVFM